MLCPKPYLTWPGSCPQILRAAPGPLWRLPHLTIEGLLGNAGVTKQRHSQASAALMGLLDLHLSKRPCLRLEPAQAALPAHVYREKLTARPGGVPRGVNLDPTFVNFLRGSVHQLTKNHAGIGGTLSA